MINYIVLFTLLLFSASQALADNNSKHSRRYFNSHKPEIIRPTYVRPVNPRFVPSYRPIIYHHHHHRRSPSHYIYRNNHNANRKSPVCVEYDKRNGQCRYFSYRN